ncbi:T-cell surface glycoprotein CD8 beta chain-like [Coregonus clupeaformis]|uniref:T-cell surface glycoprotein CD8 beta chain-like n=1 Tax=Coregonus clupeaformis TaxID=59861 RepID=UPI001BE03A62|nr:T-cell surface glycoprotein CD8 beta chain-like [Coregonus clupeaformis]
MTPLALVWTTVCLWTTVYSLIPTESHFVRYPPINDTEVLTCECSSRSCQTVFWFRTFHNNSGFQFLLSLNNADRTSHGPNLDKHRFKASKRDRGIFTLRIIKIRAEDAGLYSCMLQNQKENELWRPGVLLRPGETRPTLTPVTKPKPQGIPRGRCTKSNYETPKGCGSKVLWPLVGVLLTLAVALIYTLYYFSRLPKKCRHQFAKKRPLK